MLPKRHHLIYLKTATTNLLILYKRVTEYRIHDLFK